MNTSTESSSPRPIEFWVREIAARLVEARFAALEGADISPREARALRALASENPDLIARVRGKALRRLTERGWVSQSDAAASDTEAQPTWQLTDAGRAAADQLVDARARTHKLVAEAASAEDAAVTAATLEAIARALGWDESQPARRGPFGRGFGPGFGPGLGRGVRPHLGREFGGEFGHRHHGGHGGAGHHHGGHGHHHGGHGHHGHGHGHGHGHRRDDAVERAFERGFAAGFASREQAS